MNGGYIILDRKLSEDIVKNLSIPGEHTFTGVFDILTNAVKIGKNLMIVADTASYFCNINVEKVTVDVEVTMVSIIIGLILITSTESDKNSYTISNLQGGD